MTGTPEQIYEGLNFSPKPLTGKPNYYIYFLKKGEEIVYIGMSQNVLNRISTHSKGKEYKDFDSYAFFPTNKGSYETNQLELSLINHFEPFYNCEGNPYRIDPATLPTGKAPKDSIIHLYPSQW